MMDRAVGRFVVGPHPLLREENHDLVEIAARGAYIIILDCLREIHGAHFLPEGNAVHFGQGDQKIQGE